MVMKLKQKNPIFEIAAENPWYTGDQLTAAAEHQNRTIQRRYGFILDSIDDYLQRHERGFTRILDAGCGDGVQLRVLTRVS